MNSEVWMTYDQRICLLRVLGQKCPEVHLNGEKINAILWRASAGQRHFDKFSTRIFLEGKIV